MEVFTPLDNLKMLKRSLKLLCELQDKVEEIAPHYYFKSDLIMEINDFYKEVEEGGIDLDRLEDFTNIDNIK